MNRSQRTLFRISFAALVLLIVLGGLALAADKKAQAAKETKTADIAATVNGVAIPEKDVDRIIKDMAAQYKAKTNNPITDDMMKNAKTAILNKLIDAELLYQAGLKLGVADLDKKVDDQFNQKKKQFATPAAYEKALKETNLTEKDLKLLVRKDIVINNLLGKEIADKVTVSEDEQKKFYDENKDKFKTEESVRASHILIGVSDKATAEDKKKAREKAEAIRKRLLAGEDFAAVAKKESTCPSAPQGGDLGFFSKGQMVPEFEKAAFALKPGDISDVVETKFGYHIIKVAEKKPAGTVSYDEAKKNIEQYLKGQKVQQGVNDYLAKLHKEAKIEITNG